MKRRYKWLRILAALVVLAAFAAGIMAYLIWNGRILLNNPSRTRYPVRGVDVSHYQGEIDWVVLGQQDIDFAYIKATEGSFHIDEKFSQNWSGAALSGLAVGAYHFSALTAAEKTSWRISFSVCPPGTGCFRRQLTWSFTETRLPILQTRRMWGRSLRSCLKVWKDSTGWFLSSMPRRNPGTCTSAEDLTNIPSGFAT